MLKLASIDTRVRLALLIAALVASFAAHSLLGAFIVALLVVLSLITSNQSFYSLIQLVSPVLLLFVLVLLASALRIGKDGLSFSQEGALHSLAALARLFAALVFISSFASTTSSSSLAEALACVLSPLEKIGFPAGDVSMVLAIMLRFMPLAQEELERISVAQLARGARFSHGSLFKRLALWQTVFVPLVVALMRRSGELAQAMTDRFYTGDNRTVLLSKLTSFDRIVLIGGLCVCALAIAL